MRQKADILGKLNRENDAAKVMLSAAKLAPKNGDVWNDLCWHLLLASGPQKAQTACERSVKISKNATNTANLGHTYLLTADTKNAYRWYREALPLLTHESDLTGPQGPITAFNRFIRNGWLTHESRQARAWLRYHFWARQNADDYINRAGKLAQSIDAHPERYRDSAGKKKTAAYRHDNGKVIALLQKALVIVKNQRSVYDPKYIQVLVSLSERHERLGQYKKAEALLQQALVNARKKKKVSYALLADILERRIALHMRADEYGKTPPFVNELIAATSKHYGASHPKTIAMMKRFIAFHRTAGDVENELSLRLRLLATTEKTTPPAIEDLKRIARLSTYTDDFAQAAKFDARAKALADEAAVAAPTTELPEPEVKSETEQALDRAWKDKNWPEALKQVEILIAAHPQDAKRYRWKAYFLAQMEKNKAAIDAYRQSIAIQPDDVHAWNGLCWQLILDKELSDARRACLRSVALQKNFANTANLGHTYLLAGDRQNAYEHYRDSAALITSKQTLTEGPVKDLHLFIEKKWQPQESETARNWFLRAYTLKENRAALMPRLFKLLKTEPATHPILIRYFPATKADKQVIAAYLSDNYASAIKLASAIKTGKKEKSFVAAIRLNNQALSHLALSNNTQGLRLLERAASLATKSKTTPAVYTVAILNNLALAQDRIEKSGKGLATMRRTFAQATRHLGPTHVYTRIGAANLGALYENHGKPGKAIALYQRLLEKTDAQPHPINDQIELASRISWLAQPLDKDEARAWHDRSLAVITAHPTVLAPDMAVALNNLAVYQSQRNEQVAMFTYLQQAYNINEKVLGNTHPATLASLRVLALMNWNMNRIPDALSHFDHYVTLLERRCNQTNCAAIPNFDGYEDYAQLLGEQEEAENAYRLFELSKLRPIMQSILPRAATLTLPTDAVRKLESMQQHIVDLERQMDKTDDAGKRHSLLAQKEQAARNLTDLYLKLGKLHPKYAQWTSPALLPSNQSAPQLPPDSIFVSYLVNDGRLLALTIDDKAHITYRDLGTPATLNELLKAYQTAISQKQGLKAYSTVAAQQAALSRILLEPLHDKLQGKRRWVISYDAPLSSLPFETLRMDNAQVVQGHDIHYVDALSSYAHLKQRAAAYARTPRAKTLLVMSAIMNERTPENRTETASEAVGKLFTDQEASLYLKEQSTIAQLDRLNTLRKLQSYRYLFFAAEDKRFTGDGPRDADWLGYELHSDLVILPHTTRRALLPFELALAGNQNTLLPLWHTNDTIKGEFLRRFLTRLKAGEDQVKALNAVKRDFMDTPLLNEPAYWAPFVLHGV